MKKLEFRYVFTGSLYFLDKYQKYATPAHGAAKGLPVFLPVAQLGQGLNARGSRQAVTCTVKALRWQIYVSQKASIVGAGVT